MVMQSKLGPGKFGMRHANSKITVRTLRCGNLDDSVKAVTMSRSAMITSVHSSDHCRLVLGSCLGPTSRDPAALSSVDVEVSVELEIGWRASARRTSAARKRYPPFGYGLHVPGILGIVAQCLPQFADCYSKAILKIDKRIVLPKPIAQVLATDHFAGAF
jgi:hypothetical protein